MRFTRPTTVLFDLDGTLIDSIELILNSARHAFRDRDGYVPTDSEWLAGVGIPLATMFRRYARDEADVAALIAKYREYQLANHDRMVRPYDRVLATVDGLRTAGHPLGIVTSKTSWLAQRGIDVVGLGSHFDAIVGCDTCALHKPDPGPVLHALDILGCQREAAVFVGDSIYDMQAGNAAGVTTVAALWGPFSRAELASSVPTYYLDSIADLPRLLSKVETGRNKGSK